MVTVHLAGSDSVLVSILVWLLRDIVGLRLVLHGLTHVELLLVSTHSMVVVHHASAHVWVRVGAHEGWGRVRVVSVSSWLTARSLEKLLVVVWLLLVSILPLGVRSLLMHLPTWIVLVHVATLLMSWMIGLHLLHSHVLLLLLILPN